MANRKLENSPQLYARIGGILYLIIIIIGLCGEAFVRNKLVVPGDPNATVSNIKAAELLWRLSIGSELVMILCAIPLSLILYLLLRPVNRNIALLGAFFNIVSITLEFANKSTLIAASLLIDGGNSLKAFSAEQLHSLAQFFINLHGYGFGITLIIFGFVCLIFGYLIFKSGFIPKVFGIMMQIAGLCYIINTFSLIVVPDFAETIFPFILVPSFVGELSLCLWLIIKGVDKAKWKIKLII